MTIPDPHCTDCMPWDGASATDCQLLDNFTNRSGLPGDGWGNASYIYTNGQHLAWTVSDVTYSWVDSNLGILDMPMSSSATVSATTQAPTAYGTVGSFVTGSGYWYTVGFWAAPVFNSSTDPFPTNAKFRVHDANGEIVINLQTGVVTATRSGATPGTYTSGALSFLTRHTYDVEMTINPTTTGIVIRNGATDINGDPQTPSVVLSAVTSAAITPVASTTVDLQLAIIGGGGDPFRARVSRVELAPCERPLSLSQLWSNYRGRQDTSATSMGGSVSVIRGPEYTSSGPLFAVYTNEDIADVGGDQGDRETERRSWLSWLTPPGTQYVRLIGTLTSQTLGIGFPGAGASPATIAYYQMGPVAFNPDIAPTNWDLIGSGMNGSIAYDLDAQTSVPYDAVSSSLGAAYVDSGVTWHLFQLAIKMTSPDGIGVHTWFAAPGHADGNALEVNNRFSSNPNWHRTGHPLGDYADWSWVTSGVQIDAVVWAFGINGGTGTVVPPRTNQPVQDEFIATGDGSTQDFTTRFPYTNLSLEIEVDGVKVGVEETGATTGAFTLAFAPAFGEQIYATYRARG